jgi:hypothetical protein
VSDAKQPGLRRLPGPGTAAWAGCGARRKGKQGTINGPGRELVPAQELLTGRGNKSRRLGRRALPRSWRQWYRLRREVCEMNGHQRAAIEQARIAWHYHQFEHGCYGQDCAQDGGLYRAYQRAISGDLAGDLRPARSGWAAPVRSPAGYGRARPRP